MKNYEIVNAVFSRDKTGKLINQFNTYNRMLKQGYKNFLGYEKVADLCQVIGKLSDFRYQITAEDARVLRRYNVLVSPDNVDAGPYIEDSFVALSDFHAYDYPLSKIKDYYLNEYDKIFILGDATDRGKDGKGTGSIKLLLDIMYLTKKYPDRVHYMPGNHDEFLLGYIRGKYGMNDYEPYSYVATLFTNGGEETFREINELERTNPELFKELYRWLASQPLQRVHNYNGQSYVFGHAIFNQRLYDINPNYCFNDYFEEPANSELRRMAYSVLWFRKGRDSYNMWEMPSSGKTMIIGHTRKRQTIGKNLDVIDPAGRVVKVHCIDGGVSYGDKLLKYDGGDYPIFTEILCHQDTSGLSHRTRNNVTLKNDKEVIFQDFILGKVLKEGNIGVHKAIFRENPSKLTPLEIRSVVCQSFDSVSELDVELARNLYVKTFLFDYVLECQLERMSERHGNMKDGMFAAGVLTDRFIFGSNDPDYVRNYGSQRGNPLAITSNRSARDIAQALGPVAMEEVLRINNCKSVHDYISRKFVRDSRGKSYTKNSQIYS